MCDCFFALCAQVIPTAAMAVYSRAYIRQRTAVQILVRLLKVYTSDAVLFFWMDLPDKNSFSQWTLLATLFGNNWLALANWCVSLLELASGFALVWGIGHIDQLCTSMACLYARDRIKDGPL